MFPHIDRVALRYYNDFIYMLTQYDMCLTDRLLCWMGRKSCMLTKEDARLIRNFVLRNARPLDYLRWQYHFENGRTDHVLAALAAYQNEDGGFGHALEEDAWNPHSSPIQTSTAANILLEIHFWEKDHPLVWDMLRYLDSGADMENDRWCSVVPTNDGYPHAPWWQTGSQSSSHSEYNPTAILAGFGLYFAPRGSQLFRKCKRIALELCASFLDSPKLMMHPLLCVQSLVAYIKKAGLEELFPIQDLEDEIILQAGHLIVSDQNNWSGYACRPSQFICAKSHPLHTQMYDLVQKELDWLEKTRNQDGVWNITWGWEGYEKEFAISENWWKTELAIKNMRFFKAFDQLETDGEFSL